ncbi:unnamed protein product [Sphagnum jensenii]|uniref:DNA mismatch repair proteins mutS family domain-containing protein n=1 Tax=Sphagnum jensenii TaxID=128206 RepID=A0ABP0XI95_9BRYO
MAQQRSLFSFFNKDSAIASDHTSTSSPVQSRNDNEGEKLSSKHNRRQQQQEQPGSGVKKGVSTVSETDETARLQIQWPPPGFLQQQLSSFKSRPSAAAPEPQVALSRRFVPGFKRVQDEEPYDIAEEKLLKTTGPSKRRCFMDVLGVEEEAAPEGVCTAVQAKFDWLHPDKIRDGLGRRPDHPLYDKRTLLIPQDAMAKMSASQKQYWTQKKEYMDTLFFFKVGKFYELYELDAEIGHKEMDWKLTYSGVGKCRQVGVPESGIDDAVQKLVRLGYKVGRMEQLETSDQAKKRGGGMVSRDLTQVLSPSTRLEGNMQAEAVHLLALREEPLYGSKDSSSNPASVAVGFAFVDAAAGKFYVGTIQDDCSRSALRALLTQVAPQEILYELGAVSDDTMKILRNHHSPGLLPVVLSPLTHEYMEPHMVNKMIQDRGYFKSVSDAGGSRGLPPQAFKALSNKNLPASALGALISHLVRLKVDTELLPSGLLLSYEVYRGALRLDGDTIVNLELLENRDDGGRAGTLLGYLDSCVTKYGKRLLRRWICHPLQDTSELNDRLDAVQELFEHTEMAYSLRAKLRMLPDLERLVARVRGLAGSPSLGVVPMAAKKFHDRRLKTFCEAFQGMRSAIELLWGLQSCKDGGPPTARLLQVAMAIGDDSPALDALENIENCIDQIMDEEDEDESTLLEKEAMLLSGHMISFNKHSEEWQAVVEILAQMDVLISFAAAARTSLNAVCRPVFVHNQETGHGGSVLAIKGLWHPFSTRDNGHAIVPNDVELGNYHSNSSTSPHAMLLTGPNMGGKSTLLRATCLAVIMAQLGCFVPGESCTLSPVDIIFTRLGASDRIMHGHSTFMVECTEAASVLQNATNNSLVVLDELGRGTSTFDGFAIAYAVLRHLVETLDCRLLFATHYHALTTEFSSHHSVGLYHMTCAMESHKSNQAPHSVSDQELVFLYKLGEGVCKQSYGLQVATLAGVPQSIVHSAKQASSRMKTKISSTFDYVLLKEGLPPLHKQWMLGLNGVVSYDNEEDAADTILCIWEEMQRSSV